MAETILIIGVRRKCYKAALRLGYRVLLWSDGPLHDSRKKSLSGWLEAPYETCKNKLTPEVEEFLRAHQIRRVIANTEETVVLGARVRQFLGIKLLGLKISERFHNKFVMKNCAKEAGIPMTKYELIGDKTTAEELVKNLGLPLVVKPIDESGAQDVKIGKNLDEVRRIMQPGLLAEAFVDGSEVSVETFIQDGNPVFHNCTEYLHQWKKSVIPATLDENLKQKVIELNDRVIKHFKLDRGMTHAEFYLTKNGPLFGEIAVRPPGGYYMELIEKIYGFDPWKTYVQLSCCKEIGPLNMAPNGHAAVMLLHPGAGKISSITGEQEVRDFLSEIIEFKIRRKPGDTIDEHTNTSNEVGHILFWEKSREDLLRSIAFVEENLKFELEHSKAHT